MQTFTGFWPALITPYTPDDQVNLPLLRDLVAYQLAKGVSGFYLCGSTGEGLFLSVEERILVTETVLAQVSGRVPVIVHVGAAGLKDAVQLAQHAQATGAAGISSILPPVLYNQRGIVPYFARVAAAAPELPFLPYLLGYTRDAVALMRELAHIPNLAGTKYTGSNMFELSQLVAFREAGWTIFSGMDEQALPGLQYGAAGVIGSTVNCMPGVYRELLGSYRDGDAARALDLQRRANSVTTLLVAGSFAGALREALALLGFDCGQPRLPNLPLSEAERVTLRADLEACGFLELAAL